MSLQVIVTSGDGDFVKEMREVQKTINLPNLKQVDSKGLELQLDNLHLTTESEIKVGHMLADAYLQF